MPDGNLIGGSTGDEKKDDIIMQKEAKHGKYNHAILPTFGDVFEPTLKRPICRKFKKDWSGEVIPVVPCIIRQLYYKVHKCKGL